MNNHNNYNETSVKILKGLDPVKQRPGMYTYTDNPLHICLEAIDNATDEALAGYASKIDVFINKDLSITVKDNGRGIPTGIHPTEKISVLELVLTELHAGGKFSKSDDDSAYAFSGGLHGVGISVTNALSSWLEVTVKREGKVWYLKFVNGGEISVPLEVIGECDVLDTGTIITIYPDKKYFEDIRIPINKLEKILCAKAVLLPGVKVSLSYFQDDEEVNKNWSFANGLYDYLSYLLGIDTNDLEIPIIFEEKYYKDSKIQNNGEGVSVAFTWNNYGNIINESYVNLIPTPLGGTHESGFKQALLVVIDNFINLHGMLPRGVKIQSEDIFKRISFVLSMKVLDPQFQGQTKEKLISKDAIKIVTDLLIDPLEIWFNNNIQIGKNIANIIIEQAQLRQSLSRKVERKTTTTIAVLPGKLTDCESEDINENELFLVEGDSAVGSAKLARNKYNQAVLPLRGKLLNTFEVSADALFNNAEIYNVSVAIGVEPHNKNDDVDLSKLRYGKIAILSDADVDGSHIQVLLLTLFFIHFPKLIMEGHIYIAQPPLFRVDINSKARTNITKKYYVLDKEELGQVLSKIKSLGFKENQIMVSRFKGLGEMNPEELKDTTMHPDTRRLLQVKIDSNDFEELDSTFQKLMSKSHANARRVWMEQNADKVELDI